MVIVPPGVVANRFWTGLAQQLDRFGVADVGGFDLLARSLPRFDHNVISTEILSAGLLQKKQVFPNPKN